VDYASEATYFEVGGSASFALAWTEPTSQAAPRAYPIQGVGLNATVMAGASLGFLGIPVMVFGNWMQVPTQRYGEMSGKLDNWGSMRSSGCLAHLARRPGSKRWSAGAASPSHPGSTLRTWVSG